MRTILCVTIGLVLWASPVGSGVAQSQTINNQNYGFNLPSAPRSNGYDEVRTSDGTSCRSSMGGNGAYLDVGGIAGRKAENVDRRRCDPGLQRGPTQIFA